MLAGTKNKNTKAHIVTVSFTSIQYTSKNRRHQLNKYQIYYMCISIMLTNVLGPQREALRPLRSTQATREVLGPRREVLGPLGEVHRPLNFMTITMRKIWI